MLLFAERMQAFKNNQGGVGPQRQALHDGIDRLLSNDLSTRKKDFFVFAVCAEFIAELSLIPPKTY